MSKIFPEILDTKRQKVFTQLANFRGIGYLSGGTALSLQLNHRKSVDFDIFIEKPVSNSLKLKIKKIFGAVNFSVNTEDQISFVTNDQISITFLWYYYKRLFPLIFTNSIGLSSIKDIAADKAQTIGRRAVWRDYVDIFYFLKIKALSLSEIIQLARNKFKREFILLQFLQQLTYFDDLTMSPIQFTKGSFSEGEIKTLLSRDVEEYTNKILKEER